MFARSYVGQPHDSRGIGGGGAGLCAFGTVDLVGDSHADSLHVLVSFEL